MGNGGRRTRGRGPEPAAKVNLQNPETGRWKRSCKPGQSWERGRQNHGPGGEQARYIAPLGLMHSQEYTFELYFVDKETKTLRCEVTCPGSLGGEWQGVTQSQIFLTQNLMHTGWEEQTL